MSPKKCKHITANGYDVCCKKYKIVLGDIMGYDGRSCEYCPARCTIKSTSAGGVHIDNQRGIQASL